MATQHQEHRVPAKVDLFRWIVGILHSTNPVWKDLVIKNRKLKELVEEHQDCFGLPHLTEGMWFSLHG